MSSPPDLYRAFGPGLRSIQGGTSVWSPPGEWTVHEGKLCSGSGLHLATRDTILRAIEEEVYPVEFEGEHIIVDGDYIVRRARLLPRIQQWDRTRFGNFARACFARAAERGHSHPRFGLLREALTAESWKSVVAISEEIAGATRSDEGEWRKATLLRALGLSS